MKALKKILQNITFSILFLIYFIYIILILILPKSLFFILPNILIETIPVCLWILMIIVGIIYSIKYTKKEKNLNYCGNLILLLLLVSILLFLLRIATTLSFSQLLEIFIVEFFIPSIIIFVTAFITWLIVVKKEKKVKKPFVVTPLNKASVVYYSILTIGILPATYMFIFTLFGIFVGLRDFELTFRHFLFLSSLVLGVYGYLGLIILINGFHRSNHIKKLIFLSFGLLGHFIFLTYESKKNYIDWLMTFNLESIIGKLPLVVSWIFIILLLKDFFNKKKNLIKKS